MRRAIQALGGARPGGHYSHAILARGAFVFVSAQGPVVPETGELLTEDVGRETAQTLENIRRILEAAGASLRDVVKVTVCLRDAADFAAMNEAYQAFFPEEPPARTTMGGALKSSVVIDCVAVLPDADAVGEGARS